MRRFTCVALLVGTIASAVEDSQVAESLVWELLGQPPPKDHEPITIDLKVAEQAFRALIPRMQSAIALAEKRKEGIRKRD